MQLLLYCSLDTLMGSSQIGFILLVFGNVPSLHHPQNFLDLITWDGMISKRSILVSPVSPLFLLISHFWFCPVLAVKLQRFLYYFFYSTTGKFEICTSALKLLDHVFFCGNDVFRMLFLNTQSFMRINDPPTCQHCYNNSNN